MVTEYAGRYASMERESDGTWTLYNDVTGLVERERVAYPVARTRYLELEQHYRIVEFGRNR